MANIEVTGNLGSDSELTFTPNGKAKLEFSVGDTPRRLNQQTNQWEDAGETTWWRVTEWEARAEFWAEHLRKGTKVLILGTAGVRTYEKKDGTKGWSAEIKPKTIALIPKQGQQGQRPQQQPPAAQQQPWGGNQPAQGSQGWGNGAQDTVPF
jgi:single-strand DNA-binding protein